MTQEFVIAAKRVDRSQGDNDEHDGGESEEDLLEIVIGDHTLRLRYPTTGQMALIFEQKMTVTEQYGRVLSLLKNLITDLEEYEWLTGLLEDGVIDFDFLFGGDDENPRGILDYAILESMGRPTKSSSGSGQSPKTGGRRSTGRSRSTVSTPSSSPQTGS